MFEVVGYCLDLVWQLWQQFGLVIVGEGFFVVGFYVLYGCIEQCVGWLCIVYECVLCVQFYGFFVNYVVFGQEVWCGQCIDYFIGEYYVVLVVVEWFVQLFYQCEQWWYQCFFQVFVLVFVQVCVGFQDCVVVWQCIQFQYVFEQDFGECVVVVVQFQELCLWVELLYYWCDCVGYGGGE